MTNIHGSLLLWAYSSFLILNCCASRLSTQVLHFVLLFCKMCGYEQTKIREYEVEGHVIQQEVQLDFEREAVILRHRDEGAIGDGTVVVLDYKRVKVYCRSS